MESMSKTKKNLPKNIHEMSPEMLQKALKKRRECSSKAIQIVEKLCDEQIDEKWFLENLQFINQCHFDDVTVERSILKLCGYPLCDQQLTKVPSQQYHISTKFNQVFDITERKNFCSGSCYKSAMYVKKQLFTSPLWFRDQEKIPKYTVLKSSKSTIDEKTIFTHEEIKLKTEGNQTQNIQKNASLDKSVNFNKSINELKNKCSHLTIDDSVEKSQTKTEMNVPSDGIICDDDDDKINFNKKIKPVEENYKKNEYMQKNKVVDDINTQDKFFKNSIIRIPDGVEKTKINVKKRNKSLIGINKIERSIFEWFSLDTVFYLYEDEKLKELFKDKVDEIKNLLKSKMSVSSPDEKIDRMIQVFGLFDTDSFSGSDIKPNLKPLPRYSFLKEEGKKFDIKVKAFYQGQLLVKTPKEEVEEKIEAESKIDFSPSYMPLVDSHAQISLRRKIVLDKLNSVLPEIIRIFSSDYILKMSEVRNLITTFKLAAHNITFKPSEWYLVGIIIIKLLCLTDKQLETIMKLESSKSQILIILINYKLEKNYFDNLLLKLFDTTNLMKKLNEINI